MNHNSFAIQRRDSDGRSGVDHPFTQRPLPGHRFLKAFDRLNQQKTDREALSWGTWLSRQFLNSLMSQHERET